MGKLAGSHWAVCRIFEGGECNCKQEPIKIGAVDFDSWVQELAKRYSVPGGVVKALIFHADSRHGPQKDGVALQSVLHPGSLETAEVEIPRAPGIKLDKGKPQIVKHFMHEFPEAIKAVALHAERSVEDPGHVLYGWKSVPEGYRRYTEALGRHILEAPSVEYVEGEVEHFMIEAATAAAWNAMARLEHLLKSHRASSGAAEDSHETRRVV